jgi:chlorite dismutase
MKRKKRALSLHPLKDYQVSPITKLIKQACQDTDAASFWWLHDDERATSFKELMSLAAHGGIAIAQPGDWILTNGSYSMALGDIEFRLLFAPILATQPISLTTVN